MYLTAWVTALDLDRRMADREATAEPVLQVADDVLGIAERAILDDHVHAERHLVGRKGPHVEVVHAGDQFGAGDLACDRREVDLARGALEKKVHRLAHYAPGPKSDQDGDGERQQRVDVEPARKEDH